MSFIDEVKELEAKIAAIPTDEEIRAAVYALIPPTNREVPGGRTESQRLILEELELLVWKRKEEKLASARTEMAALLRRRAEQLKPTPSQSASMAQQAMLQAAAYGYNAAAAAVNGNR